MSLGDSFGVVEGEGAGDELRWVGDAGVYVAGSPLGGGVESSEDSSEPATETSPSPSNCGISAITDMSLVGSLGGWRWRFAGGAGGDGLVVVTAPAAPVAFFLAAARVSRAAATVALVVVAADAFGAAAARAAVAADADAATAA